MMSQQSEEDREREAELFRAAFLSFLAADQGHPLREDQMVRRLLRVIEQYNASRYHWIAATHVKPTIGSSWYETPISAGGPTFYGTFTDPTDAVRSGDNRAHFYLTTGKTFAGETIGVLPSDPASPSDEDSAHDDDELTDDEAFDVAIAALKQFYSDVIVSPKAHVADLKKRLGNLHG